MTETNIPPVVSPAGSRWRWLKMLAVWIPALVAIGAAGFFYWQWQQAQQTSPVAESSTEGATEAQRKEIDTVIADLGKVVLLPTGELPTLSTIKDKDALTENQEFFLEAENGDKVIVYQKAKKAFLYRPGTKKLINLAPINIADADASQAQPTVAAVTVAPSPSPEVESFTVELRNGTSKQGLTHDFEPKLLENFEQIKISDRTNAARENYEESMAIAVNLTKEAQAQQVANELGLVFADLPAGEPKAKADVLIILGADQL